MKKKIIALLLLLTLCFSLFETTVYAENSSSDQETSSDFKLHMLNVGEGLSILIQDGEKYALYDGGDAASSSYVVAYLKKQKVEKLEYVIASHYDADHLNGIIGALHTFTTETILEPDYVQENDLYKSYDEAANTSKAKRIHPKQGDSYKLDKAGFTVVGPKNYDAEDVNDRSIAIQIEYGDIKVLVCADAGENEELEILNSTDSLKSDAYVVDHHGGSSSSTDLFLGNVKPKYALLSCGKDNGYGHPAERVLDSLKKLNCELYRTDVQGEIIFTSDGKKISFNTAPTTDWSAGKIPDPAEPEKTVDPEAVQQEEKIEEIIIPAAAGVMEEDAEEVQKSPPEKEAVTYVCNTNTHKFHYTWCNSVKSMKDKNKWVTTDPRDSLIANGYEPCKNCNP